MAKRDSKGKFLKGVSGNPDGVPKGLKQKSTELKEAFLDAFYKTGGPKGLIDWIKRDDANLQAFYNILIRILPKEIEASITEKGGTNALCSYQGSETCPFPQKMIVFSDFKLKNSDEKDIVRTPRLQAKEGNSEKPEANITTTKESSKQVENRTSKGIEAIPSQVRGGWGAV